MNKKGIEPVVATVLLIVITIAAVALIIAFVVPFVQRQLSTADLCLKAQGIQIDPTATCYSYDQGSPTNVTVKVDWSGQSEAFTLSGIKISISNSTYTASPEWEEENLPRAPGESRTAVFRGVVNGTITQISIAPVIGAGRGKLITCEMRSITPQPC